MSGSRKTVNPLDDNDSDTKRLYPVSDPEERDGTLLGGRLRYRQFSAGYRTGLEPVLMAAAVPALTGESVLEAGCGAGAALLCLSHRIEDLKGIGLEHDSETVGLANRNFSLNHGTATLEAIKARLPDIPRSLRSSAPNANGRFHHVMANPPWHNPNGTPSPDSRRRLALHAEEADPNSWISTLTRWVLPGGSLTFALPAAAVDTACATLLSHGCGSLQLYPLWPKAGREAKLVILRAIHGGRSIFRLRAGMILHQDDGQFTAVAENVLRQGQALPEL
ncbi:N-6 DNA methylase [Gluconobacter wancherniae]|uniref:tRNA1(Val) (adenine(37)-N6)-methyltransferase n=1 Tax=Gluconobacter wancherniae TaxID=1307955 RepID=UPI0030A37F8E